VGGRNQTQSCRCSVAKPRVLPASNNRAVVVGRCVGQWFGPLPFRKTSNAGNQGSQRALGCEDLIRGEASNSNQQGERSAVFVVSHDAG